MQSKELNNTLSEIYNWIREYYETKPNRSVCIYANGITDDGNGLYINCLIDRTHVIQYNANHDRGGLVGTVCLAIGPHFFNPGAFWGPGQLNRFSMELSKMDIYRNLSLLDEFLKSK